MRQQQSFLALVLTLSLLQQARAQDGNTKYGDYALFFNTTGSYNTANGAYALYNNTTGLYNTAIGSSSLFNNNGSANTAVGNSALSYNTTGYFNSAFGTNSLSYNTTGFYNNAFGVYALFKNTTGSYNTVFGNEALLANITGSSNTASGTYALNNNTTGSDNTASGYRSLYLNKTGLRNTAIGDSALLSITKGSNNTALGYKAGSVAATYTNSTFIGSNTTAASALINVTLLGYGASATASNQVRVGNNSVTSIGGKVGWSTLSDGRYKKNVQEDVPGLSFINKLRPVTYTLDIEGIDKVNGTTEQGSAEEASGKAAAAKEKHTGFIAQEVEKAAIDLHYDFGGVDKPKNDKDLYGLRYAEFVVPLVKAVQELSKENQQLKDRLDKLEAFVNGNTTNNNGSNNNSYTNLSSAYLEQSTPNPSNGSAIIRYHLLVGNADTRLVVTDMKGSLVKSITLNGNGNGQVTINIQTLAAGTYNYTLYVNGNQVDSKQMLVTR